MCGPMCSKPAPTLLVLVSTQLKVSGFVRVQKTYISFSGCRVALGPTRILQYALQGLFHPARKVSEIISWMCAIKKKLFSVRFGKCIGKFTTRCTSLRRFYFLVMSFRWKWPCQKRMHWWLLTPSLMTKKLQALWFLTAVGSWKFLFESPCLQKNT